MTSDRTKGRVGRSKAGGDPSIEPGRQGGSPSRVKALGALLAALACLVAGAALLFGWRAAPDWPPPDWLMVVCDVGQGDAILLSTGPHSAVAVDTGPDPAAEGRCLKQFQITAIPLLVLTHFHADHIGGLSAALADARVGEIETTTVDVPPAGADEVRREAAAAGVPVHRVTPHERRVYGPVSWQVLWPDPAFPLSPDGNAPEDRMPGMGGMGSMPGMTGMAAANALPAGFRPANLLSDHANRGKHKHGETSGTGDSTSGGETAGPNNTSIVIAVTVRTSGEPLRILLTGDIEQPVQADLLAADRAALGADVLKVPHHGSANQDPDFVRAVDPGVSIISVGEGNPYGHPVPRTVRLMGSTGARLYRTDQDGAVVVSLPTSTGSGSTAAYTVTANHGAGQPPGSPGASGSDSGGSDQGTQPRRSEHRHQKSHSHQQNW